MTNPSPGPGWWLASDGKWYPQQWEYTYFRAEKLHEAYEQASVLGKQGWEMVNFTHSFSSKEGHMGHQSVTGWLIACFMKRPVSPD
jgi:hypothetical protein